MSDQKQRVSDIYTPVSPEEAEQKVAPLDTSIQIGEWESTQEFHQVTASISLALSHHILAVTEEERCFAKSTRLAIEDGLSYCQDQMVKLTRELGPLDVIKAASIAEHWQEQGYALNRIQADEWPSGVSRQAFASEVYMRSLLTRLSVEVISRDHENAQGEESLTRELWQEIISWLHWTWRFGTWLDVVLNEDPLASLEIGAELSLRSTHTAQQEQVEAYFDKWSDNKGINDFPMSPEEIDELDEALKKEFTGVGLVEMKKLGECFFLPPEAHPVVCYEREWLVNSMAQFTDLHPQVVDQFLRMYTLDWGKEESDSKDYRPWRYKRDRSYFRRPLIPLMIDGKERILRTRIATETALNFFGRYLQRGQLVVSTPELKQWSSKRQNSCADMFVEVVQHLLLQRHPEWLSEVEFVSTGVESLRKVQGVDYGGVDLLVADPQNKVLLVSEVKYWVHPRNPSEQNLEFKKLLERKTENSLNSIERLWRKTSWVEDRKGDVLRKLGVSDWQDASSWSVQATFITDGPLYTETKQDIPMPCLTVGDIVEHDC